MVYKKIPSDYGLYVADDGSRYEIYESTKVMTPNGVNYMWDTFNNIDEAAAYYGVVRIPEPEGEVNAPDSIEDIILQMLREEVNS